jgi:GTPase SAR1 family protein
MSNEIDKINENLESMKVDSIKPRMSIIILGMAGSGKTTFVKKFEEVLVDKDKETYVINMDPAVKDTLYEPNMDIRDTINYKEVMTNHSLGPNGAIMTCLNLFATSIHKIIDVLEKKEELDYILIDTPGQLEVFSWSASGQVISDSFSVIFPTVLIYVVDIPRCQNPNTFASNMLYALSIMYKMKQPLIIVFNKKDIVSEDQCFGWMSDYENFMDSLDNETEYISSFSRSMCLVLEEFYKNIKYVAVSSKTGDGYDGLITALDDTLRDYMIEKEKSN